MVALSALTYQPQRERPDLQSAFRLAAGARMASLPGWRACVSIRVFGGGPNVSVGVRYGARLSFHNSSAAARRRGGSRQQGEAMKAYATQAIRNGGIVGDRDTRK